MKRALAELDRMKRPYSSRGGVVLVDPELVGAM
jgi:hypothetical protein